MTGAPPSSFRSLERQGGLESAQKIGFIFPGDNKNAALSLQKKERRGRVTPDRISLILAHRIEIHNRADDSRRDWSATGQTGTPTRFKRGNSGWQEAHCASALKANVVVEKKCWLEVQLSKLKVIGWQIALTAIFFVFKQTIRSLD